MSSKNGFSLIEVLVFVAILSVTFVIVIAVTISSLRNVQLNQHKILATRYAEELIEWVRIKKEIDWNAFIEKADSSGITYCFNATPIDDPDIGNVDTTLWASNLGSCSLSNGLDPALYKRELVLTQLAACPDGTICQVSADINVTWDELGNSYEVPIHTVFSVWEQE
jgi:type II secretory pathway pseudopilin PulG